MDTNGRRAGERALIQFLLFMTVCYAVSFVGSEATLDGLRDWYPFVRLPAWSPPVWVFGPILTVLYGLMGVALFLVWRDRSPRRRLAISLFVVQLLLGGLWPWLFFVWHLLFWSFAEIIVLSVLLIVTTWSFSRATLASAWLMVPSLLWTLFLAALNLQVYQLNRHP